MTTATDRSPILARHLMPALALAIAGAAQAWGADDAELAKQLVNPVSPLMSVQARLLGDRKVGPDEGRRYTLEIEPVVPVSLGAEWNLVSHTQLPYYVQHDVAGSDGTQTGFGDLIETVYLTRKDPKAKEWLWGAGPVIVAPTATETSFGPDDWGFGAAGTLIHEVGPWSYGLIGNHIWRGDDSATLMKPFIAYTTKDALTVDLNLPATYDWQAREWSMPLEATVSRITRLNDKPVSIGAGVRYWLRDTAADPEGFGLVLTAAMLFPR